MIVLNTFADHCRKQINGNAEQLAQLDALMAKAQSLPAEWFEGRFTGLNFLVADGRTVAQAVSKA